MSGTAAEAITLPERLDGATVPALWSTILPRVQPGAELVLDPRGTRAIDTAGVALILAMEERTGREGSARGGGGRNPSPGRTRARGCRATHASRAAAGVEPARRRRLGRGGARRALA